MDVEDVNLGHASATFAGLFLLLLAGCNAAPAPPGTLAADPALEYGHPSLTVTDVELGPGDQIAISVFRHPELTQSVEIPSSGLIFLPLAGEIDTRRSTPASLRRRIAEAYQAYIVEPQVSIDVTVRRSQRVLVLGEVRRPGVFNLSRPTSTVEMVALAGGFTRDGDGGAVYLHRLEGGEPVQRVLDVERLLNQGAIENNPLMEAGDIIYVPPSAFAKVDRFARHVSTWITPALLGTQTALNVRAIDRAFNDDDSSSAVVIGVSAPTNTASPTQ